MIFDLERTEREITYIENGEWVPDADDMLYLLEEHKELLFIFQDLTRRWARLL